MEGIVIYTSVCPHIFKVVDLRFIALFPVFLIIAVKKRLLLEYLFKKY